MVWEREKIGASRDTGTRRCFVLTNVSPGAYPSGLMVGFIADYESGEIKLQKDELSAGAFYSKENMPEIPRKLSIARKMIDWWLSNN